MHDTQKTFSSEKILKKFILLDKLYVRLCHYCLLIRSIYDKVIGRCDFLEMYGRKKVKFYHIFFSQTFGMIINIKICVIEKSIDVIFFLIFGDGIDLILFPIY